MKPTITILDYLARYRNTEWLKHHSECECSFEALATEHIENSMTVDIWCSIRDVNGSLSVEMIRRTVDDWESICGPKAEYDQLQAQMDQYMERVTRLMAMQAATGVTEP